MISKEEEPISKEDLINSIFFIFMVCALAILKISMLLAMDRANIKFKIPCPKRRERARTKIIPGKARKKSTTLPITSSTAPPIHPENVPNKVPIIEDIDTTIKETEIEILPP